MNEEKPRLARLTAILTQLQSKRIVTATELACRHQVSIRTIYRDIRTLEKSGIPIVTEEGRGYSMMEGYQLSPVMFTEGEANALITAEQLLAASKDASLGEHYQAAITKIRSILRGPQKEKSEFLSERIAVRSSANASNSSKFLIQLQSAITNFQPYLLNYIAATEEQSTREIEPFALYHTKENWILVAYCRLRHDFRSFRLDRIQELTSIPGSFAPHNFTLQEFFQRSAQIFSTTSDTLLAVAPASFAQNQTFNAMQNTTVAPFNIIGISLRTSKESGQAPAAIGQLWERFFAENIPARIPNPTDAQFYSVYNDYEGDYTQGYTMTIGMKVDSLDNIPEGLVGASVAGGQFRQFVAKGNIPQGAMAEAWENIWKTELPRTYQADFEVYGEKAMNPLDAEVDIFVGVSQ